VKTRMDKEIMCFQVNKGICEAYGCFERATTQINVKVGQLGTIPLDLCFYCVKKFDVNTPGKEDPKQKTVTNEERKDNEAIEE
jgi:hypothetical protein